MSNKLENAIQEGENLCDLATELVQKGELKIAITHYESAVEVFKSVSDLNWTVFALHEKFICHQNLGEFLTAISLSDEIIELYQKLNKHEALALFLVLTANVHMSEGNSDQALVLLRIAEEMILEHQFDHLQAHIKSNLAACLINLQHYLKALDFLNQAAEEYEKQKQEHGQAWCYEFMGRCYEELYMNNEAEKQYFKSQRRYLAAEDPIAALNPLKSLEYLYDLSGKKEKQIQMQDLIIKIEGNPE